MPPSHQYAQTNLQLYSQLRGLNYSDQSLGEMQRAYDLSVRLFSGRYRANGKPFISHLIGTASILAAHGAAPEIVVAGMLHAAYLQGQFGDNQAGLTADRARILIQYSGEKAADLVAEYTRFSWNKQTIDELQRSSSKLVSCNQNIILMRLANELEDYLDQGMLYCRKPAKLLYNPDSGEPMLVDIAKQLGFPGLAAELEAVYAEAKDAQVPEVLSSQRVRSFTVETRRPGPLTNLTNRLRKLFHRITT